mgnify:CR=1 FL=1
MGIFDAPPSFHEMNGMGEKIAYIFIVVSIVGLFLAAGFLIILALINFVRFTISLL